MKQSIVLQIVPPNEHGEHDYASYGPFDDFKDAQRFVIKLDVASEWGERHLIMVLRKPE